MKSPRLIQCSVAAFALAIAPFAIGNGLRLVSHDAFATARGEAFVATADNPSAIYYNPAGLAQLEGDNLRAGLYGLYLDPTFTPPATAANAGQTYQIKQNFALVPETFYSHSAPDSAWSFGAGLYAPYGAGINWGQDTGFRAVTTKGRLTYLRFSPVAAVKVSPQLALGFGLFADYGDLSLEQGLRPRARPFANYFRFQGDGWSTGGSIGVLWKPDEKVSIGATVRSQTRFKFEGKTEMEQQPIIRPTSLGASMELEFPLTAVIGISFRPTTNWNIEVDADYTDWSCVSRLTIRQNGAPPFPVQRDIPVNLFFEGSWTLSAGATRYLGGGWHISAGYVFNQNSVPDDYYSPLLADLDRHFFTAGAGRKGKRFDFDIAYQFGYGPNDRVTGSLPPSQPGFAAGQNGDGTYHFISHAILVSFGIHF